MREWFTVTTAAQGAAGAGEILIYDAIGRSLGDDSAVGAKPFVEALNALAKNPGDITIRINSPGGNVAEGTAIYSAIRGISKRVVIQIDGWAASIASLIALAGRECRMSDVGQFMIHNPSTMAYGSAAELRKAAKMLDGVKGSMVKGYRRKSGLSVAAISKLMDDTTWMSAKEAKANGFVDVVTDSNTTAATATAAFDAQAWTRAYGGGPEIVGPGVPVAARAAAVSATAIAAACPGASAEFVAAHVEASRRTPAWGLAEIRTAYITAQNIAIQAIAIQRVEAQRAALRAVAPPKPAPFLGFAAGVDGPGEAKAAPADPVTGFEEAIAKYMAQGKTRAEAGRLVARKHPEINAAYVAAYNKDFARASI